MGDQGRPGYGAAVIQIGEAPASRLEVGACRLFLVNPNPKTTVNIPTIGSQTGRDNCELGVGNNNPGVGILQRNLNSCHGAHLTVDSDYGSLTRAAVQAAQRAAGIPADGIYGPQTRSHITWIDSAGHCIHFS